MSVTRSKLPVTTPTVFTITAVVTVIGLWSPTVLLALKREPDELARGEYWRLLTSLLVQNHDWRQITFNFCALLLAGILVERRVGPSTWLALYFSAGVLGQISGVFWKPSGAGNSVATCGLVGAVTVWMLAAQRPQVRVGGAILLLGAIALLCVKDLHGPPLLLGALVSAVMHSRKDEAHGASRTPYRSRSPARMARESRQRCGTLPQRGAKGECVDRFIEW